MVVITWLLRKWNKVRKISMQIISVIYAILTKIFQVYFGRRADIYHIIGDLIGIFLGVFLSFIKAMYITMKPHI